MKNKFLLTLSSLLMVGAMAFSFAACGGGGNQGNTPNNTTTTKTHDQTTHVVTGSTETQHHNFVNGKCTMCDQTTTFRQDAMYKAGNILLTEQAQKGTLEGVWYKTRAYGVEEKFKGKQDVNGKDYDDSALWIYKKCWVYLPYGYNKEDTSKKYNVMYMMHGDKLNEGYWFGQGSYATDKSPYTGGYGTENVLDYLKMNNLSEDTIYVGVTMYQYYTGEAKTTDTRDDATKFVGGTSLQQNVYSGYISGDANDKVDFDFGMGTDGEGQDAVIWKEWKYHLMPTIVSKYNTYTDASSIATKMADPTNYGLTEEDTAFFTACENARDHVAYTGLSRGGASVNSVLGNALEYISYFAYESAFTPSDAVINNMKAKAETYPVNYIFMSCGSQEGPTGTDAKMLAIRDAMGWQNKEGSNVAGGDRIEFIQVNGTAHNYATWITNLFNFAQVAFKAPASK
ncbi:MAG: hypothetical protein NC131_12605 [Roseburia sp.]|nr:hypothetical protein [Roseburia sp.]